jgi:hypothetical protein
MITMEMPKNKFDLNAQVLFVPTGTGGQGLLEVEAFYKQYSAQSHLFDNEIISRIEGDDCIVEQSIVTCQHSENIDWILPGVRPTKKQIKVPLCTVTNYQNSLIVSRFVYWDQASVLRQIGVLPRSLYCKANSSEVTLPVLAANIVDGFSQKIDSSLLLKRAASMSLDDTAAGGKPTPKSLTVSQVLNGNDDLNVEERPSSRVIAPPGGVSNIFGPPEIIKTPGKRISSASARTNVDIFSPENIPVAAKRNPNWTETQDDAAPTPEMGRRQFAGKNNESHFSLAMESEGPNETIVSRKHFAVDTIEEQPAAIPQRRDPNARSQEAEFRPSSRYMKLNQRSSTPRW